jgi:hypothetical protein
MCQDLHGILRLAILCVLLSSSIVTNAYMPSWSGGFAPSPSVSPSKTCQICKGETPRMGCLSLKAKQLYMSWSRKRSSVELACSRQSGATSPSQPSSSTTYCGGYEIRLIDISDGILSQIWPESQDLVGTWSDGPKIVVGALKDKCMVACCAISKLSKANLHVSRNIICRHFHLS